MLVLSRKVGEKIHVGDNITLTILESRGNRIRVGIEAPRDVRIVREEVVIDLNDCSTPVSSSNVSAPKTATSKNISLSDSGVFFMNGI